MTPNNQYKILKVDNLFYIMRNDGRYLDNNDNKAKVKINAISWTYYTSNATAFTTLEEASAALSEVGRQLELSAAPEFAIDKRLRDVYNTYGFTNDDLEIMRRLMVEYAYDVLHDTKVATENQIVLKEYHGHK